MELILQTDLQCPHCGEFYSSTIDTTGGSYETVEDCAVCCAPILVKVECEPGELFSATTERG